MNARPPKLSIKFLQWYCRDAFAESIQGDLEEQFEEDKIKLGTTKAKWRFTWNVIRFCRPGIIKSFEGTQRLNNYGMFKNYFKVGIRNILKYKTFSFINIFGLAVSMSISMLIMLMLADQKLSDQFHTKKERIYRIIANTNDSVLPYASTSVPLAIELKEESPSIEKVTHLRIGVGGDASFKKESHEIRGFFADPDFLDVFSFELDGGNRTTALEAPNSMVITKAIAKKLFKNQDPVGKIIRFSDRNLDLMGIGSNDNLPVDWGLFTITGVIAEKGYRSHLKFDVLVSESSTKALIAEKKLANLNDNWSNYYSCYTYALLEDKNQEGDLNAALDRITKRKYVEDIKKIDFKLGFQKLGEISPGPFMAIPVSLRMPIEAYYVLAILAAIIMFLACLNYINLSIARASTRAREIGIRKVNGSSRIQIIFQFFSESFITSLFSLAMAFALLIFIKSSFMNLWVNEYINFNLAISSDVFLSFLVFTLAIALVIGAYPALYMSKLNPLVVFKGNSSEKRGKLGLRKVLNISQFTVSLFFIVTSMVIYNQFKHFLDFEYGFDTDNIVNVELQSNSYQIMATELGMVQGVSQISANSFIPASGSGNGQFLRESGSDNEHLLFTMMSASENYTENLGLQLLAGRNLPEGAVSADRFVVINEYAAKKLGYESSSEAVGKNLEFKNWDESLEIIGVVENFQFKSLFEEDRNAPLILRNQPKNFRHLNIKIAGTSPEKVIEELDQKWNSIDPVHGFKYQYFDQQLASMNSFLKDVVAIVGFISVLAIIISCLGLLGMAVYTSERRQKEVGIRKVLGASVKNLTFLLSWSFVKMLLISILIAAPLSYFVHTAWLESLPNRVEFGLGTILVGSLALLFIGLLTIGFQITSISKRNPVDSLKDE